MTAGPQARPNQLPFSWTHLDTLKNIPSRIFFDNAPFGISQLGLETPPPVSRKDAVALNPLSPFPQSTSLENYFYSVASLHNVVEVMPCCLKTANISVIIGLLLRYIDGDQTSVGEVRLDLLADSIRVDQSEKMILGFSSVDGFPYVASVHFSHVDRGQSILLDVHWTGYLEWWFSRRQCKIYHNGQASPATRL